MGLVRHRHSHGVLSRASAARTYGIRGAKLLALLAFGPLGLFACHAKPPSDAARAADAAGAAGAAARATAPAVAWSYEVHASSEPRLVLRIDATFVRSQPSPAPHDDGVVVDDAALPFVHDVDYAADGGWRPAPRRDAGGWRAPCVATAAACGVRYTVALEEAGTRLDDIETAWTAGGLVVAPPSTWLVRPVADAASGARFRFHVTADPPLRFATGVHATVDGGPASFEASVASMDGLTFAAFGAFTDDVVTEGDARIEVATASRGLAIDEAGALAWVKSATSSLAAYYGVFRVPHTLVVIAPGERGGTSTRGETLGEGGPSVVVRAANGFTRASIHDDWVLTHELIHVTLPTLGRAHAWLEEGVATYVEPIVRARVGLVTPEQFWRDLVEGLPQGLPEAGDQGLERTHTWGRTYWGGALFCFLADVRIRERTGGARSFDDVLRAFVRMGADTESLWEITRFIEAGDRATGTTVLSELYREMALAPGTVDLGSLWTKLGVHASSRARNANGANAFDDAAPWAAIRRGITDRSGGR
jgi:hypothetical protein